MKRSIAFKRLERNPTSKLICFASVSVLAFGSSSCGKDVDTQDPLITLTASKKADSEEQSGSQLQDLSEAISSIESGSVSLSLADSNSDPFAPTKTCTPSTSTDGKVTVIEVRDSTTEDTKAVGSLTRTTGITLDSTRTNTWTPASGQPALSCSDSGSPAIKWGDAATVNGLSVDMAIEDTKFATITFSGTNKRGIEQSLTLGRTFAANGNRTITHSGHAIVPDTSLSIVRTVTSSVQRIESGTRRKPGGTPLETEDFNLTHTNATASDRPLIVQTDIDLTATGQKKWAKKTVKSGTTVSTGGPDGNRVESSFSDVVFEAGNCVPTSGSVSGKIWNDAAAAEETPTSTFVISFGCESDSGVCIAYDGGSVVDFPTAADYLNGCSFSQALKTKAP